MYLLYHAFRLFASLKEVVGNMTRKVDACRIISQEIIKYAPTQERFAEKEQKRNRYVRGNTF